MQSNFPENKVKILEAAIPLFAEAGFNGVSMRSLATEVGLNPATLYHHFQDKHTLYMAAMSYAFARRAETLSAALGADAPPEQRLKKFAEALCRLIHDEPDFNKLIQREILAEDNKRLQLLADQVFHEFFTSLLSLCGELAPGYDSHMLAISIVGLMAYHYQITPLRRHLLGSSPDHDSPEEVAAHVVRLLLGGVKEGKIRFE
ncbi:MAG: TetR/AcrR family transcriptional regulator [Syntrophotaleaceae bacterium]